MKEEINFSNFKELEVMGEYTIQLFDKDTGKLVEERKKHNVVNKILFSTAYYNYIMCGIIDNDSKRNDCYGNKRDGSTANIGHVNWLVLTNDEDAEADDYKNPVILGDMVGYAHSSDTNSYSDTKRGLINTNETAKINNYVEGSDIKIKSITKHFVWDFATDKGNGTFDNVYLTGIPLGSSTPDPNNYRGDLTIYRSILINKNNIDNPYSTDSGILSHDNQKLYMQCFFLANTGTNNVQSRCYNAVAIIDLITWNRTYITLQVPSSNSGNAAYIVQAGGYFWRIEYNFNCTKYNLNGEYISTISLASKFSSTPLNTGYGISNIAHTNTSYPCQYRYDVFTGDENYLYIGYMDNSFNRYICVFDNNCNKISEVLVGKKTDNTTQQCCLNIVYINNKKYLLCTAYGDSNKRSFLVNEDGTLKQKSNENLLFLTNSLNSDSYGTFNCFFYSKRGELFGTRSKDDYNNSDKVTVSTFVPWTSHCKLDSPVTKTSTNTMKIQYDVTVDYVPIGMIENLT